MKYGVQEALYYFQHTYEKGLDFSVKYWPYIYYREHVDHQHNYEF